MTVVKDIVIEAICRYGEEKEGGFIPENNMTDRWKGNGDKRKHGR